MILEHGGDYGRAYVGACNYESRLETEFKLTNASHNASFKLRNRHQFADVQSGASDKQRQGGQGSSFAVDSVDAHAVGAVEPRQRLLLGVAAVTGFGLLIDLRGGFAFVGGKGDAPLFVQDANLIDAGLRGDGFDRFVHLLCVIVEHAEARAALDGVADAVAGGKGEVFEVVALQADALVAEHRKDARHHADETDGQLET